VGFAAPLFQLTWPTFAYLFAYDEILMVNQLAREERCYWIAIVTSDNKFGDVVLYEYF